MCVLPPSQTPDDKELLQKRLKRLKQKLIWIRNRISLSSCMMRKFPLGQDRYARQYWVLPSLGGILIEGVETSLDANLQLQSPKEKVEREEELAAQQGGKFDFDGQLRNNTTSRVIIREDLRQPQGVGLSPKTDNGGEGPLPGCVASQSEGVALGKGSSCRPDDQKLETAGGDSTTSREAFDSPAGGNQGNASGNKSNSGEANTTATALESEHRQDSNAEVSSKEEMDVSMESSSSSAAGDEGVAGRGSRNIMFETDDSMEMERGAEPTSGGIAATVGGGSCVLEGVGKTQAGLADGSAPMQMDCNSDSTATATVNSSSHLVESPEKPEQGLSMPEERMQVEEGPLNMKLDERVFSPQSKIDDQAGPSSPKLEKPISSFQSMHEQRNQLLEAHFGEKTLALIEEHNPWFSIFPRQQCESGQVTYSTNQIAQQQQQGVVAIGNQQVAVASASAGMSLSSDSTHLPTQQSMQQQQQQQHVIAAAPTPAPAQQIVYVTPEGQVVGGAQSQVAAPQVVGGGANTAYALVGNTLVPVGGQTQTQYVAVNSGAQPGVQYLLAQPDQQGGVQYFAIGGNGAAAATAATTEGGGASSSGGAGLWQASHQPQYLAIGEGSNQQIVQVVGREDGGQMLVQVVPEQGQMATAAAGGQVIVAAAQPQGGQVVMATAAAAAAAAAQPQAQQVVIGQGQSGQVVLATPQGNQVVVGQGQGGQQVILAAPQGTQAVVGHGQSGQMFLQGNQIIVGQGQSGQLVFSQPDQQQLQQQLAVGQAASGQSSTGTVITSEQESYDIIRGGQVVQLPDQDQYGILSSDGTKLLLAESKESAIATLQAASAAPPPRHHASPAPPTLSSSPAPSSQSPLTQHQRVGSIQNIKKEPQSPVITKPEESPLFGSAFSSRVVPTPTQTPPLTGKATPTAAAAAAAATSTVGQPTAAAETVDLTRGAANPEVSEQT